VKTTVACAGSGEKAQRATKEGRDPEMRTGLMTMCVLLAAASSRAEWFTEPGDALLGAGAGEYSSRALIQLIRYRDLEDNGVLLGYRYYLGPVEDSADAYWLQPFLQKASYVEGGFSSGPLDAGLFSVGGQYVFPETPVGVTAGLGFGDSVDGGDLTHFGAGVVFYVARDNNFAVEGSIERDKWTQTGTTTGPPPHLPYEFDVKSTIAQIGARFVMPLPVEDWTLELAGGFRSVDVAGVEETGAVIDVRCFFGKDVFAGLSFSTDTDEISISGGYAHESGLEAEVEIGEDDLMYGDYMRIGVGMRF
jgi:hypothetical protein